MASLRLSEDMAWLVVFKRVYQNKSEKTVIEHLSSGPFKVTREQIRHVVRKFHKTGHVLSRTGVARQQDAARREGRIVFNKARCRVLVELLLDSPDDYLSELRAKFTARTGVRSSLMTLCRAIKAAGYSRKNARLRSSPALRALRACAASSLHV